MTMDDGGTALLESLTGPVLRRGDPGFAAELAAQNTLVHHDPDLVVGAADAHDVELAVRWATAAGMPVRVLATGHGGWTAITDGLVVTTSRLTELAVDPATRIARIGAGHRWSTVIAAAAEHGLAPIAGSSDHVGVVGYLLGGGLGPFARRFGVSSDRLRAVELVTADGELRRASADEHPGLFWALRGGKGGFGVVTAVELELVPLETFYGGSLFYDGADARAVLTAWAEFTLTAPEEVTTSVAIIRFPPLDVVPQPLRGRTAISLRVTQVGDAVEGERITRALRESAAPLVGRIGVMPASAVALVHNDPTEPSPIWDRGMLLEKIATDGGVQEFVDAVLDVAGPDAPAPFVAVELRHLGGAAARDVPEGSAVGGRAAGYSLVLIGVPDPALFDEVLPAAADAVTERLRPWVSASTTINFAGDLSVAGSYEASWPAEMSRASPRCDVSTTRERSSPTRRPRPRGSRAPAAAEARPRRVGAPAPPDVPDFSNPA